jgi:hypothetical protein
VDQAPTPPVTDRLEQRVELHDESGQRIGGRWQRYANRFTLPNGAAVRVRWGRPEGVGTEPASTTYGGTPDEDTIWLDPAYWSDRSPSRRREARETLLHELAHRYDRRYLTDIQRARFQAIMGLTGAWRAAPNSPHEQFAEAAALWMTPGRNDGGYGFAPNRRQRRALSRLFETLRNGGTG